MERRTRSSSSAARNREKGPPSRKAELVQEKHLQMKERFQDAMRKKDQELSITQSMLKDQKVAFEHGLSQLKKSMAAGGDPATSNSEDLHLKRTVRELQNENEFLREELMDIKDRYNELLDETD